MDIMVNGEHVSCEEGITLESLVAKRGHDVRQIAVEWNERIVPKEEYGTSVIHQGDVIEIVTFMGGG
ncbi:MAG: sulfur carrier protein ThiS [Lachnospiraceae bacterium]|jgi:sulfur carrier protein|nr:sulfur carrier protein ThiS [Lachnospiraceae bacterium]